MSEKAGPIFTGPAFLFASRLAVPRPEKAAKKRLQKREQAAVSLRLPMLRASGQRGRRLISQYGWGPK
jgi:hypothetical protein